MLWAVGNLGCVGKGCVIVQKGRCALRLRPETLRRESFRVGLFRVWLRARTEKDATQSSQMAQSQIYLKMLVTSQGSCNIITVTASHELVQGLKVILLALEFAMAA